MSDYSRRMSDMNFGDAVLSILDQVLVERRAIILQQPKPVGKHVQLLLIFVMWYCRVGMVNVNSNEAKNSVDRYRFGFEMSFQLLDFLRSRIMPTWILNFQQETPQRRDRGDHYLEVEICKELIWFAGGPIFKRDLALELVAHHLRLSIAEGSLLITVPLAQIFDVRDHLGCTALDIAVRYNRETVTDRLLRAGADPTTSLYFACSSGGLVNTSCLYAYFPWSDISPGEFCRTWIPHGDARAERTSERFARVLDLVTSTGNTLLHFAARAGRVDLVRLLIKVGIDVDVRNSLGEAPLHWALKDCRYEEGQVEIINTLVNAGANIDAQDDLGNSVLHYSVSYASSIFNCAAELLIRNGANVSIRCAKGNTVLHKVAKLHEGENVSRLIRKLLEAGASVDVRNAFYETPLHIAARHALFTSTPR